MPADKPRAGGQEPRLHLALGPEAASIKHKRAPAFFCHMAALVSRSILAYLCACAGPILDAQLIPCFDTSGKPVPMLLRPVFQPRALSLPSLHDALLVLRPLAGFRDGLVVSARDSLASRLSFSALAWHEDLAAALLRLVPGAWAASAASARLPLSSSDGLYGFAAKLLVLKSYASCLLAELSQLCYKALLRAVALASTDGASSFHMGAPLTHRALAVPVGRIGLGRIFNVLGSVVDGLHEMSFAAMMASKSLRQL